MRIRITTTFTDKQAIDQEHAEIAAGSEITVTADRGAELVGLGLAEEIGGTAAAAARKPRRKRAPPSSPAPAQPPAPVEPTPTIKPADAPAPDAVTTDQ